MKKIICLVAVVLMIASVAFAAGKMKITAKDLPGLKGTWEGIVSFVMTTPGDNRRVEFFLYRNDDTTPLLKPLFLLINVAE